MGWKPKQVAGYCQKCKRFRAAVPVPAEGRIDVRLGSTCKTREACKKELTGPLRDVLARDVKALAKAEEKRDKRRAKREANGL